MNIFYLIFILLVIFNLKIIFIFWKNIKSTQLIKKKSEKITDRQYWLDLLYKISYPLLNSLSKGELKKLMPIEKNVKSKESEHFAYLEALGRLLCGISPWIELNKLSRREIKIKKIIKL